MNPTLTLKFLNHFGACKEGIDFVLRNKLIGLPLSEVKYIKGINGFLNWLKGRCNIATDSNGNVISHTNCNGDTESWTYNDRNSVTQHTHYNGSIESFTFTYYDNGQLKSVNATELPFINTEL